jgi:uncharacterized protein YprB with RNaseH-like and TPR domain
MKTPYGPLFLVETSYRSGYRHGKYRLDEFDAMDRENMDIFCGGSARGDLNLEDFLFIDLETTGLSLGTGTYAFLVGMGYFREGKYHIRQCFLRSFQEEDSLISNLKEWILPFRVLVSFNGKRFDVPVLETRFSMCGQTLNTDNQDHWDLLYPARRLWKGRQEDCRLETLERKHLGVEREGQDIPGSRIPEVYYRYVHDGDTRDLDRIVYHNAMDILTLTTLAIHTDWCMKERDPSCVNLVSIGRFYEKRGMAKRGVNCYEIAARQESSGRERDEALYRLALQRKRDGRRRESIALWEELIERGGYRLLDCCEEVAKVYEHETREWEKAIHVVDFALKNVQEHETKRRDRLLWRLNRLERKRGTV